MTLTIDPAYQPPLAAVADLAREVGPYIGEIRDIRDRLADIIATVNSMDLVMHEMCDPAGPGAVGDAQDVLWREVGIATGFTQLRTDVAQLGDLVTDKLN